MDRPHTANPLPYHAGTSIQVLARTCQPQQINLPYYVHTHIARGQTRAIFFANLTTIIHVCSITTTVRIYRMVEYWMQTANLEFAIRLPTIQMQGFTQSSGFHHMRKLEVWEMGSAPPYRLVLMHCKLCSLRDSAEGRGGSYRGQLQNTRIAHTT